MGDDYSLFVVPRLEERAGLRIEVGDSLIQRTVSSDKSEFDYDESYDKSKGAY